MACGVVRTPAHAIPGLEQGRTGCTCMPRYAICIMHDEFHAHRHDFGPGANRVQKRRYAIKNMQPEIAHERAVNKSNLKFRPEIDIISCLIISDLIKSPPPSPAGRRRAIDFADRSRPPSGRTDQTHPRTLVRTQKRTHTRAHSHTLACTRAHSRALAHQMET